MPANLRRSVWVQQNIQVDGGPIWNNPQDF
jgi:hypothetical protein